MRVPHQPHHWIPVAIVIAASLFTLTEVWGQHTGTGAEFEGRPAMSGAQAGIGPLAGPPQGGIGVQTNEDMINARRAALSPVPSDVTAPRDTSVAAPRDRDRSVSQELRPVKKVKKASRRVRDRRKHPVPAPAMEAQKAGS